MPRGKLVSTPKQASSSNKASATLVEQQEDAALKPRRVLGKQNTEQLVGRCTRDNFRDLSETEVRGIRVGGLTLAEMLARDKRPNRNECVGAPKMGKFYMNAAREKYSFSKRAASALTVADRNIEINLSLVEAIGVAVGAAPDYSKLLGLFQTMEACTQTDAVGISKFLLDLKPAASQQKASVIVEGRRLFERIGGARLFPDIMEHMRVHFDGTLCHALAVMKSSGMKKPLRTFWSVYRPPMGGVCLGAFGHLRALRTHTLPSGHISIGAASTTCTMHALLVLQASGSALKDRTAWLTLPRHRRGAWRWPSTIAFGHHLGMGFPWFTDFVRRTVSSSASHRTCPDGTWILYNSTGGGGL